MTRYEFTELLTFLGRVPAITGAIGHGVLDNGNWWVKFGIDIDHQLAWQSVQEFANVLNYLSVSERLPTVFKPVSPPVYLNGGPREFLSWVIESTEPGFSPSKCCEWLTGRLPRPVDDISQWASDEAD